MSDISSSIRLDPRRRGLLWGDPGAVDDGVPDLGFVNGDISDSSDSSSGSDSSSHGFDPRAYFLRAPFFIALAFLVCMIICCFRIIKMIRYRFVVILNTLFSVHKHTERDRERKKERKRQLNLF